MAFPAPSLWLRLRTWVATRLGLWRGRWQRAELELPVARFPWWPWSRDRWSHAIYRPGGLRDDAPAPLVLLLHGCGQQALAFAQASGWVQAAERERFRLLCPEQHAGANPYRCWNWFMPAAQAGRGELDVAMQALARTRAEVACTDVVAVGLSAGGGLAALLAFHHAEAFAAVVAVAAPPLLGRVNLQDPRQVMRQGLAASPTLAALGLAHCAPLLVLHGADDEVVTPRCAEQLAEQARSVHERAHGPLQEQAGDDGITWLRDGRPVVQRRLLPGLAHAWSGGPGGHAHVLRDGPPLVRLALAFVRQH